MRRSRLSAAASLLVSLVSAQQFPCSSSLGCLLQGVGGLQCSSGYCGGYGASCSDTTNCQGGYCSGGRCIGKAGDSCPGSFIYPSYSYQFQQAYSDGCLYSLECSTDNTGGGTGICGGGNSGCTSNSGCVSGSCVSGQCVGAATGATCSANGQCTSGICTSGKCAATAIGGTCSANVNCASGLCSSGKCQAQTTGGSCTGSSQCASQYCSSGVCALAPTGTACTASSFCQSTLCSSGVCSLLATGSACTLSSQCQTGNCASKVCALQPNGGSCSPASTSSKLCQSGYCGSNGLCGNKPSGVARLKARHNPAADQLCGRGRTACTVKALGLTKCLDLRSDVEACGSCENDCLQLEGVADATCWSGRCYAKACRPGFVLSPSGSNCVQGHVHFDVEAHARRAAHHAIREVHGGSL